MIVFLIIMHSQTKITVQGFHSTKDQK